MSNVDVSDDRSQVTLAVADTVTVRLPENAGTGYQWSLTDVPHVVELEESRIILPDEPRPGAAAERLVVLRARAAGTGRVILSLARVFEQHPAETFVLDVEVDGS